MSAPCIGSSGCGIVVTQPTSGADRGKPTFSINLAPYALGSAAEPNPLVCSGTQLTVAPLPKGAQYSTGGTGTGVVLASPGVDYPAAWTPDLVITNPHVGKSWAVSGTFFTVFNYTVPVITTAGYYYCIAVVSVNGVEYPQTQTFAEYPGTGQAVLQRTMTVPWDVTIPGGGTATVKFRAGMRRDAITANTDSFNTWGIAARALGITLT